MKKIFHNLLTIFIGVSFIFLLGCPKKVTPVRKSSRVRPAVPATRIPKPPKPPVNETIETIIPTPPPLIEEEIPRIAKIEEADIIPPVINEPIQEDIASALKDVFFDLDQFIPHASDLVILEKNANWIIAHPKQKILIEGHGDSRGTNEYNLVLGEKRANSIKSTLVTMGVEASRLTAISYGEERPFCPDINDDCYQENRRVHFYVK